MKQLAFILCVFGFIFQTHAQESKAPSPILFIYDASGSMWGQLDGKTKKEIASDVLSFAINNLPENQNIGLIAYGHRQKGDCKDVEFMVDLNNNSKTKFNAAVKSITPLGMTPLAYSATQAINSLKDTKTKATIILVTDGIESCDGNICDVVTKAKTDGIDFKLHIVGFGLKKGETKQLECAAKAGGGNYYDAADAGTLGIALNEVSTETIDKPEGNLGVYVTKNGKPLDAQVHAFLSGKETITDRKRTYKDTAYLYLPEATYDLKVYQHEQSAISAVTVKGVQTYNDKTSYKTISLDGAKLKVITKNNDSLWDCQVSIKTLEGQNVIGGRTYAQPKLFDVDPGSYNIELHARTTFGVERNHTLTNVSVGNGEVKEATHNFKTGIAIIGGTYQGKPFDVQIRIVDAATGENVYGKRSYKENVKIIISPGKYIVTLVEHGVYNNSAKSTTFNIEVKQGETIKKIGEL